MSRFLLSPDWLKPSMEKNQKARLAPEQIDAIADAAGWNISREPIIAFFVQT